MNNRYEEESSTIERHFAKIKAASEERHRQEMGILNKNTEIFMHRINNGLIQQGSTPTRPPASSDLPVSTGIPAVNITGTEENPFNPQHLQDVARHGHPASRRLNLGLRPIASLRKTPRISSLTTTPMNASLPRGTLRNWFPAFEAMSTIPSVKLETSNVRGEIGYRKPQLGSVNELVFRE